MPVQGGVQRGGVPDLLFGDMAREFRGGERVGQRSARLRRR